MVSEKRFCSICAWRGTCQKKYSIAIDAVGNVHCPDYSRDIAIKDQDVDAVERAYRTQ